MSHEKIKRISAIITSALTLILGISFIVATAHLYYTGSSHPYSRERVGEYLSLLIIPSILTLISVAFGGVLSYLAKNESTSPKADLTEASLKRLSLSVDVSSASPKILQGVLLERRKRFFALILTVSLVLVFSAVMGIFLLNFDRYTLEGYGSDILTAFLIMLPSAVGIIGVLAVKSYFDHSSKKRELSLLHTARLEMKASKSDTAVAEHQKSLCKLQSFISSNSTKIVNIARAAVAVLAIAFTVIGITNGGMADVLGKAVRICTECIGLG